MYEVEAPPEEDITIPVPEDATLQPPSEMFLLETPKEETEAQQQEQYEPQVIQEIPPFTEIEPEPMGTKDLMTQGSQAYQEERYADAVLAWQQVLEKEPGEHPDIEVVIKDAVEKLKGTTTS